MKSIQRLEATLLAVLLTMAGGVRAADFDDFVRLATAKEASPVALEVAIASYVDDDGRRVDLVSAVHVAERAYFEALDRRLAGYPVVLYELVGEPEALQAPRGASLSAVGMLQGGMKEALGLAYQLDWIDYGRDNMVHADLTAREFATSMRERGESLVGLMFRAWALALAEQGAGAGQQADLLRVLFAEDRQLALKRMLGSQLAEQAELLERMAGEDGSTLIEVRNARALDRLREQFGQGARTVAIFYGAAHMPDIAERLIAEFGMEPAGSEWIEAWDLRGRSADR
jgi:hypothetical protein